MPKLEEIEALAKRRGFFWISSEIYGGFRGFYDYGPLGTALKRKIENAWREHFLRFENFYELDTTTIMPDKVFEASGHIVNFVDPIARCKKCGTPHRADHIMEEFLKEHFEGLTAQRLTEIIKRHNVRCPRCKGPLGDVETFNMMFELNVGPLGGLKAYLRPETAQGAYINFIQAFETLRKKLPLGLAIIGRAYRNEISPRQLLNRMREFTQAELQIFFDPQKINECDSWAEIKDYKLRIKRIGCEETELTCEELSRELPKLYIQAMALTQKFFFDKLKIQPENFRFRELSDEERAFYNKLHWDVEIKTEALKGFKEVGGVHYRTDHDLKGHQAVSKKSQQIFYDGRKFIPHVIEISLGIDRILLCLLDIHYVKEKDRTFLKLPKPIAPFTAAVFPLVNKDGLPEKAAEIYNELKRKFDCVYDDSGSIGKRYYRQDEIGTFTCITIDYQTLKDQTVTIRNRDTKEQKRIKIENIAKELEAL